MSNTGRFPQDEHLQQPESAQPDAREGEQDPHGDGAEDKRAALEVQGRALINQMLSIGLTLDNIKGLMESHTPSIAGPGDPSSPRAMLDSDDARRAAAMEAAPGTAPSTPPAAPARSPPPSLRARMSSSPLRADPAGGDIEMGSPGGTAVGSPPQQLEDVRGRSRSYQPVSGGTEWRASVDPANDDGDEYNSGDERDRWGGLVTNPDDEAEEGHGHLPANAYDNENQHGRVPEQEWGSPVPQRRVTDLPAVMQTRLQGLGIGDEPRRPLSDDGAEGGNRRGGRAVPHPGDGGARGLFDPEPEDDDAQGSMAAEEKGANSEVADDEEHHEAADSDGDGSDVFVLQQVPGYRDITVNQDLLAERVRDIMAQANIADDAIEVSTEVRQAFEAMSENAQECTALLKEVSIASRMLRDAMSETQRKQKELVQITCATILAVLYKREALPDLYEKADALLTALLNERTRSDTGVGGTAAQGTSSLTGKKRRV